VAEDSRTINATVALGRVFLRINECKARKQPLSDEELVNKTVEARFSLSDFLLLVTSLDISPLGELLVLS
jgi:hypothetical protein